MRRAALAAATFVVAGVLVVGAGQTRETVTVSPALGVAGHYGTWTVTYTVGPGGIEPGGAIRVQLPDTWHAGERNSANRLQAADPTDDHLEMARRKGTFWQREKGPLCRVVVATWPDGAERREATSRRVPINAFSSVERGPSGSVGRP